MSDLTGGIARIVGPGAGRVGAGIESTESAGAVEGGRSFKDILSDSIDQVNQLQKDADLSLEKLNRGEGNQEEVMIAFKKAQIAFEALMQIRNKIVDAFEELQRMRI